MAGNHSEDILDAIAENFPDKSPADLMNAAMGHLAELAGADREVIIGWCFESTRDMYRRLVEIGDYPNALRAIKQMRDLAGK